MLNIKSQVFRLAILKIIRIKHQKSAWLSLILYCMKSSLLSLLMTTPYLVLLLTVLKISITKDLFFFLTFCCIILRFLVLQIITVLWEIFKKSGKTKNKLRTYTLKIMKGLRTASLGSNFTGSYKKRMQCTVSK